MNRHKFNFYISYDNTAMFNYYNHSNIKVGLNPDNEFNVQKR